MAIYRGSGGSVEGITEANILTIAITQGGTGAQTAAGARTNLGLGTAATTAASDYATAAQGTLADSAVQPADLGAVATSNSYDDLDDLPTLGTAAAEDVGYFATAAQGALADSALQSDDIGISVQAYDAQLADVAGLTATDNGVIIGNGTNFVVESGSTLRTSLGLAIGTDVLAPNGSAASLTSFPTLNQNTTGTADNVTGVVAIANGGTGQTTAVNARAALLPTYATNAGKVLAVKADASDVEYITVGGSGTVTSVDMTVPTGLAVSGNPVTTTGTLAVTYSAGYAIPTTAKQTEWDTAYGWGNHASSGYAADSAVVHNTGDETIAGLKTFSTGVVLGRVNSGSEGGQVDLCRSSDNTSAWAIDVYGSTSTPSIRIVDNVASVTRMEINGLGDPTFSGYLNVPNTFGFKNRIIDGGFILNQRGYTSGTSLSSNAYGHDRWKAGSGGGTYTFTQGSLGVNTTVTITAGTLVQVIEGCNLAEGGTYVLSWTGTAQGRLNGGSYGSSGSVTVTGWTAGTNLSVEFNTGTLGSVQLEKGSTATSFDYRPYGTELALCQRYYEKSFNMNVAPAQNTGSGGGAMVAPIHSSTADTCMNCVQFAVRKRSSPTVVTYNPYAVGAGWSRSGSSNYGAVANSVGESTLGIRCSGTPAINGALQIHWTADSEL